jgi:hypothetical protein
MIEAPSGDSQQHADDSMELANGARYGRRVKFFYGTVLFLLYLAGVLPRLRVANYDEPDLTYGDENMTIGQAETLLRTPGGKIQYFHKAPGAPHFLFLTFKPYYWLAKGYFGWQSLEDVQWWRVRRYWRALNDLLGGLTIILAGMIGARAFNRRVGLLAAALCAASALCAVWLSFMKEEGLLTLSTTIVVYAACRLFLPDSRRLTWIALAGLATGSALAFKYNAAPVVPFFLLVLFLTDKPPSARNTALNCLSRFRIPDVLCYGVVSAAALIAWFPQLISRTNDVWISLSSQPQIQSLNLAQVKIPSVAELLSVAWATWENSFHRGGGLADIYPLYFFILMTAIVVGAPVYAIVRRQRFVLALSVFVWLMYLTVYYQWLFSGWKFRHYFLPAIAPIYLLVACGLDGMCGKIATWIFRRTAPRSAFFGALLLVVLCAWPLWNAYDTSLRRLAWIRSSLGSVEESRALRRNILRSVPAGAKVFVPMLWVKPFISDSFLDNRLYWFWHINEWGELRADDLARQGFDIVCAEIYPLQPQAKRPVYLKDLAGKKVKPLFTLPRVSHFLGTIHYIPVQPGDGESFNLGLYFREPRAGDFAGVRGKIPSPPSMPDDKTTQNLVLKARLYNELKPLQGFLRWEISLDGKTLWHGRDTTDTTQVALSLPIQARPGAEILIRTMRTDFRQEATWGWGGPRSQLKVDGLKVIAAESGKLSPIQWAYTGVNGGRYAPYGMRSDWLHNENPPPLLDLGFEGEQPLVDAWRSYQMIEPRDPAKFGEEKLCRKMAYIEKAGGAGIAGSNALRFRVGFPAKEFATLGIMQPIAYPASQQIRRIRVHYRTDGEAENRDQTILRLAATGLSLSGEHIDRAEIKTPLASASGQWHTVALDIEGRWKSKHARTDLMDFLEIAIETTSGPDAVLNCLIDNVELE